MKQSGGGGGAMESVALSKLSSCLVFAIILDNLMSLAVCSQNHVLRVWRKHDREHALDETTITDIA